MDKEGFSGIDGRTTIFDYWSLHREENDLSRLYAKVLNIVRHEKAVSEGLTFDLMYVNRHCQRQYAFIRKAGNDTLLVAANFDGGNAETWLTIPAHAFDYLSMDEKTVEARDLISGETTTLTLSRDGQTKLLLPANGAVVLKF